MTRAAIVAGVLAAFLGIWLAHHPLPGMPEPAASVRIYASYEGTIADVTAWEQRLGQGWQTEELRYSPRVSFPITLLPGGKEDPSLPAGHLSLTMRRVCDRTVCAEIESRYK